MARFPLSKFIPGLGKSITIQRGDMEVYELEAHEIPFGDVLGADGADLSISTTAGDFNRNIGTNQLFIDGEPAVDEQEVSVGWFRFTLPRNYKAGGTVSIRAIAGLVDAGVNEPGVCTIDFEARLQGSDGAVGADLVATAATALTTTFGAKDFVVTPTGLVAGDVLVCKMTTDITETAGNGNAALTARITKLQILCDTQG